MNRQEGFSLVESLVALVIVSAGMGVLMQALGTSARSANTMEERYLATVLAQSNINRVGAEFPLEPSIMSGQSDIFHWELEISVEEEVDGLEGFLTPFRVGSRVTWEQRARTMSVRLATIRLQDDD